MSDEYLWDRSGEPDPEVERLERLLAPLGHRGGVPAFPALPARGRRPLGGWVPALAAAAALVFAVPSAWRAGRGPAWDVASLAGTPQVGAKVFEQKARLGVGEWLETDAASRALVAVGSIGEVELEPRTRVRLVDAGRLHHRLALARGILHARIWAPPRSFFVETPSAVAVDLGCAYTLEVDAEGAGLLKVQSGWVGFEHRGRESFVPEGARCVTRPGFGPGTPFYDDAPEVLQGALATLDFGPADAAAREAAFEAVLGEARRQDALTLWHLLVRVGPEESGRVFDRMADLVPPPRGVTREGVLAGDRGMLDLWWNALDLGSASWWRLWKGPVPFKAR